MDDLLSIRLDTINNILSRQPTQWLANDRKNDIINWWTSDERAARIAGIRKGIGDGSYL